MREQPLDVDPPSGPCVVPQPRRSPESPLAHIELDLTPPGLDTSPAANRTRRTKWPLVGIVVVAAVAVLIGRLQRPDPPNLGTVLRATAVFQCQSGMDTAFEIDVVNQVGAAITLSGVEIDVAGAPGLRTAFGAQGDTGPCRPGWSWRSARHQLLLAADDLGMVLLAYPRVCRPALGPVFSSVRVNIDVRGRKIVRDITPDPESLRSVNENTSVTCDT